MHCSSRAEDSDMEAFSPPFFMKIIIASGTFKTRLVQVWFEYHDIMEKCHNYNENG